ncbi:hypothetical protein Ancab_013949 [Ancistrocladus abbreviatus]
MGGKKPNVILVDQESAIGGAINKVTPGPARDLQLVKVVEEITGNVPTVRMMNWTQWTRAHILMLLVVAGTFHLISD